MRDPRPMQMLLGVVMLGLLLVVLWWASLPVAERRGILLAVAREEDVRTGPPDGLVAQARWLMTHRLAVLRQASGVLALGVLIGGVEGWLRRGKDVHGGFLITWWTTGVMAGGLLIGGMVVTLCLPQPIPPWSVPAASLLLGGVAGYGLTAGRPYVP